jgi:hypothetical protein
MCDTVSPDRVSTLAQVSEPPPPPPRLNDVTTIVALGTTVWFLLWAALLIAHVVGGRPLDVWFHTTLIGWLLGLFGYTLFQWQRRASRRGSRGAQRDL